MKFSSYQYTNTNLKYFHNETIFNDQSLSNNFSAQELK